MVQFIDLKRQYSEHQQALEAAVLRVLRSGQYIMGPQVEQFERRLADHLGVRHAITCSSGTDALVMALMAKQIGPGDAVFTVPFTFMATAEAIARLGAVPVFVDVDPATFNMDVGALGRAIDALRIGDRSIHPLPDLAVETLRGLRPRAILPVDLFGLPADYGAINSLAAAKGILVIEDAAQSLGASCNGVAAGRLAEVACTSFFPAKPLGCYGDGGALFTDDAELADVLRSIRVHGQGADKYENVRLGLTARLDTIQAAILDVKLDAFDSEIQERQRVAECYRCAIELSGLDLLPPFVPSGFVSAWAQYTVVARDTNARRHIQAKLAAKEIPTAIYYPKSLHLQKAFDGLGYRKGDFPVSEDLSDKVFSLPMHPYLSDTEIEAIVTAMKD